MAREIYLLDETLSSYYPSQSRKRLGEQVEEVKKLGVGQGDVRPLVFHGPEQNLSGDDAQFIAAKLGASAVVGVDFFPRYRDYKFGNARQCTALIIGSMAHALSKAGIQLPVGSSEQFVIVGEPEIAQAFKQLHVNGVAADAFHVDPKAKVMNHYYLQYVRV
jgi:hypothetical protein